MVYDGQCLESSTINNRAGARRLYGEGGGGGGMFTKPKPALSIPTNVELTSSTGLNTSSPHMSSK